MGRRIVSLLAVLTLISAAWAQDRPDDVLRAAQAGNTEAQLEMGILYEYGFYMEKNRTSALAWYMFAAAQGNQKANERRDLLMRRMSQSDIKRARLKSAGLASAQPGLAPKAEQTASTRITRDALGRLLHDFVRKYQAGDLDQFISLFAENVQGNERRDRAQVRKDYEDLFQTTDVRRMRLIDVNWQPVSGAVQVWGRFEVTVRKNGEREVKTYIGKLKFHVEKQGARLLITRLYHSQTKV